MTIWQRMGIFLVIWTVLPGIEGRIYGEIGIWATEGYLFCVGIVLIRRWRRESRDALGMAYQEGRDDAMEEGTSATCLARSYQQGYQDGRARMAEQLREELGGRPTLDLLSPARPADAGRLQEVQLFGAVRQPEDHRSPVRRRQHRPGSAGSD